MFWQFGIASYWNRMLQAYSQSCLNDTWAAVHPKKCSIFVNDTRPTWKENRRAPKYRGRREVLAFPPLSGLFFHLYFFFLVTRRSTIDISYAAHPDLKWLLASISRMTWHMSVATEQSWINVIDVLYVLREATMRKMMIRFPKRMCNM